MSTMFTIRTFLETESPPKSCQGCIFNASVFPPASCTHLKEIVPHNNPKCTIETWQKLVMVYHA